jgi:CopG family nickel-responsive transcriptional regulator
MGKVIRFGVSIDPELLESLDEYRKKKNFSNRSQALRFIIEDTLVTEAKRDNREVCGALVLIYDHHKADLVNKFISVQHDYQGIILSSQHIHIDHDTCMETISLKGKSKHLQELSDKILAIKGMKHGKLVITAV